MEFSDGRTNYPVCVAPLAGAWIEIAIVPNVPIWKLVAPLAGAWIEIQLM